MTALSVLIPARNEEWINRTVADVLEHTSDQTEVIVVLDGAWPAEPLAQHPRLQVVFLPESIGQRAATNYAARLSTAKYICKLDAHCSIAQGFDAELIRAAETLGPDCTQIPAQRNLNIYDRVCTCGRREYQGSPSVPCVSCGKTEWTLDVVWKPRPGTTTKAWSFNAEPKFQYGGAALQPEVDGIRDVMSALGACFFMRRDRFWALGGLDEAHGSWGSYGIEIACKSWLSGGRHVVNTNSWFAHFFRVGGIGFPYEIHGHDQDRARSYARNLWLENKWPGQVRPLSWLLEKFWPVNGWTQADLEKVRYGGRFQRPASRTAGIVYYSDCRPDHEILEACRRTIEQSGLPIVAVTLAPIHWPAARTIVMHAERGVLTMFKQILAGLEALDTDDVFFCEHDCAYPTEHFAFRPQDLSKVYYNRHVFKVDAESGRAVHYRCDQTSGLCADRRLLIEHYRKRVQIVEETGYTRRMGFEPGTHGRAERVDDLRSAWWWSERPLVDIRHGRNLTPSKWRLEDFKNKRFAEGFTEADSIPGWGTTKGRMPAFIAELGAAVYATQ